MSTKITDKQLYERRNTSDVFTRLIIMGLLRILNMKLVYEQVWNDSDEGIEQITVPFFYDFTGGSVTSERFIQDNYINWTDDECTTMGIKKMDGDYKPIPFGEVSMNSTSIDSGNISNRFVMGQYQKKIAGELQSFVSFLYSIPLSYAFTVTVKADTMNTAWKIEQSFREYFYKNKTYHVNYKGTIVPVRVGFPESISQEKTAQYTVGTQNDGFNVKLTFDIQCETYQPVFDRFSEMNADHMMKYAGIGIGLRETQLNEQGNIKALTNLSGVVLPVESEVLLQWKYNYDIGDLLAVDILYEVEGEECEHLIETVVNHNFYYWQVPPDLIVTEFPIDITIPNADNCTVHNVPDIRLYPDPDTGVVSEDNVVVISKGFFQTDENYVDALASYINKDGKIIEHTIKINLRNGMVDESNPISMTCFVYNNVINTKRIRLLVRDNYNKTKYAYFCDYDDSINSWLTVL